MRSPISAPCVPVIDTMVRSADRLEVDRGDCEYLVRSELITSNKSFKRGQQHALGMWNYCCSKVIVNGHAA